MTTGSQANIVAEYPDHVAVIGGGRWARVLTEALLAVVPGATNISIYTPGNSAGMRVWAETAGLQSRLNIDEDWPSFDNLSCNAAIVVNAARDHEKVTERLLAEQVHTLVEKPVTLSAESTQKLMQLADSNKASLCAAHIFRFTTYIDEFIGILDDKNIASIAVTWVDPGSESRYGERKQYDAGLPIITDWFPHILSILDGLFSEFSCDFKSIDYQHGGSCLYMELAINEVPCRLKLQRNGKARQRRVEVETSSDTYLLDFSVEPGVILINDKVDEHRSKKIDRERPSSLMLRTFLTDILKTSSDARIDISLAYKINQAIDQAIQHYDEVRKDWLSRQDLSGDIDDDQYYALAEILQRDQVLNMEVMKLYLDKIRNRFNKASDPIHLLQSWISATSPVNYLDDLETVSEH